MDDRDRSIGWNEALGEHGGNPANGRRTGEPYLALGRQWLVAPLEQRLKGQFETWVKTNAKRAIRDAELNDGPEEADDQRSTYQSDLGAGYYRWDGRHCRKARKDVPGLVQLMLLLLRRCDGQEGVTEEQVMAMLSESPAEFMAVLNRAVGNAPAPPEARQQEALVGQKPAGLSDEEWEVIQSRRASPANGNSEPVTMDRTERTAIPIASR